MTSSAAQQRLPWGVGQWSAGWSASVALSLAALGFGVYAYSRQVVEGEAVTGLRDLGTMGGAPWGLYVVFIVYFVGVSFAGITVAALIRLFNLEHLRPISRMAEALTVVALVLGALSVLADLGQPLRGLLYLPRYGRPMSPFFGTFTLVISGYLFASLVYLYLDGRRDAALCAERGSGLLARFHRLWAAGYRNTAAERRRHQRATFWLAVAILPLLVTAHSTLGFVFGIQSGRPGWYSELQAPGFVILAGVSGIGLLIVIAATFRRLIGAQDALDLRVFRWLGRLLLVLTLIYLYLMVVEWLTMSYAAHHHEARIAATLVAGEYAWLYWGVVAALAAAVVTLVLPHLPVAAEVRLPAFRPALARTLAAATAGVLVLAIIQTLPGPREVAMRLSLPTDPLTWILGLLLVLLTASLVPALARNLIASTVFAAVLVNVAAVGKRFLIVVPSQTHGTLLPYETGAYSPTWVEYGVILGLLGLGSLLFTLFVKVFPIMEVPATPNGDR